MKYTCAMSSLMFLLLTSSWAGMPKDREPSASMLPHTIPQMRSAGFWISRHPDPDKIIISPKEIGSFNRHIQDDLKLTRDIFSLTQGFKTDSLLSEFDQVFNELKQKDYFTETGSRDSNDLLDKARLNMNTPGIVLGIVPRYGLVMHPVDVRFLPTESPLYESPGDVDFDQLQNSTLDTGVPVAVVHQSADKKWFYVYAPNTEGWVQAERIAIGDQKTVQDFAQSSSFVVAVAAKSDLYLNDAMTSFHDRVHMGARLPLVKKDGEAMTLRIPTIDAQNNLMLIDAHAHSSQFHEGFLTYNAANVIQQAFVMLDKPYGWGGMYGEQDCSAFLDEVFATVGINLPRDSKDQALVGNVLADFKPDQKDEERLKGFSDALGGQTLLPMKGHIMLYLGNIDGKPYAIHCVWAYRKRFGDHDVPILISKVTVSDLSLGEGSARGSLLKRLTKIISVEKP